MQDQRIIYNGLDISPKINDFRAGTQNFVYTAGSYLYVGSIMPFNNLWFDMGTANVNSTEVAIDIWWANAWYPAVDICDETNGLTSTGRVSWATDRFKGWSLEDTTERVTGLTSHKIYNRFWLRFSWSNTFSAGSVLKYIGQKFANDSILYSYYPDLQNTNMLESFQTGKTSWDEQHYMAAESIIDELKRKNIVQSKSQLLDWTLFQNASCRKVAEIAYTAFGRPYFDQLELARKDYKEALNMQYFGVDLNQSGNLDQVERRDSTSFMRR